VSLFPKTAEALQHKLTRSRRIEVKIFMAIGILLIVVGIVSFVYHGVTYTTQEKVVDIGPIHMTAEKTKTIPLTPVIGGITLLGGIVLVVMGSKKYFDKTT
jgi:hypothetical protein